MTMKVRMTVTIEVDPAEWMENFGCDRDEIREDVRGYFETQISQAEAVEDCSLTVRVS